MGSRGRYSRAAVSPPSKPLVLYVEDDADTFRLAQLRLETRYEVINGEKPVIAAVEGFAFGAGLSLAAASDYMVVAENAKLRGKLWE